MNGLTALFLAALAAETAARLWLATRQMRAVRAQREHVPAPFEGEIRPADQRRAADYAAARLKTGRWATAFDALVKVALTLGGGLAAVDGAVARAGVTAEPWHGAAVVAVVIGILQLLGLPWSIHRTFRIEARFGFNRTSPALYAADLAKQLLLGLVLGGPLVLATLYLMERAGVWWWVWGWLMWLAVALLLTWAAPRFIAPLFNRFTAITDARLESQVRRLLERCGFSAAGGVFVMDGSRRSAHGNAYFTGIGRHKRIVFFDTLLARIEIEEVEAVLAHELGHFKLRHVTQRLIVSMAAMLAGLALLGALSRAPYFYAAFRVPPSACMALIVFALVVPVFTFFATPFESWWARRQELAADDFAARVSDPRSLSSALVKLYRDNATVLTPDPVHSAFYDSHPTAVARIARLRLAAAHAA